MTHRYYPEELRTSTDIETKDEECPTCKSTDTEFLRYDDDKVDGMVHETHKCHDCGKEFDVAYVIPFLKEHLC